MAKLRKSDAFHDEIPFSVAYSFAQLKSTMKFFRLRVCPGLCVCVCCVEISDSIIQSFSVTRLEEKCLSKKNNKYVNISLTSYGTLILY